MKMTEHTTSTTTPNGTAPNEVKGAATDIKGILERFQLPGFDVKGFLDARKLDVDAMTEATSAAFAGSQTIVDRQADLLKTFLTEIGDVLHTLPEGTAMPAEIISRQQELATKALSSALTSMKDIAETARKSQSEIMEIAATRMRSNVEEIRDLVKRAEPKATSAK
jgi:phasin family protein